MSRSIMQKDDSYCFLCGGNRNLEPLDEHHIFGGPYRDLSEEYGLKVYLHHSKCHIFGKKSVHMNSETSYRLKAFAQRYAMSEYKWTKTDFIKVFGKSYI